MTDFLADCWSRWPARSNRRQEPAPRHARPLLNADVRGMVMRLSVPLVSLLVLSGAANGSEPVEVLHRMECPCPVVRTGRYLDGGSVGGVLQCANGDSLEYFWDSGMRSTEPATSLPPRLLYIGTDSPAASRTTSIAANSSAEKHLVDLLQCFVDSVFSKARQEQIVSQALSWSKSTQEFNAQFTPVERLAGETLGLIYRIKRERAGAATD